MQVDVDIPTQQTETKVSEQPVELPAAAAELPEIVVQAGAVHRQYWRDLWNYRELLFFLAWRDILVRYKQTAIGIAWAVLRPLITMIVFSLIFGALAGLPSVGDTPYALLVLAGMLPWQFVAGTVSECGSSILSNANLITKVYFPRVLVPASVVLVNLVDLAVAGSILVVLMAWYGCWPTARILALPLFLALGVATALGIGAGFAALTVKYRDFRYVVPFVIQMGLYVSPVGYGSYVIPERWRLWYSLNPMVAVIDGFRWCLLADDHQLDLPGLLLSAGVAGLVCFLGLRYFRKTERYFADIV